MSMKAPPIHHAARRRRGVAAGGARAAGRPHLSPRRQHGGNDHQEKHDGPRRYGKHAAEILIVSEPCRLRVELLAWPLRLGG
jgi:hypothetical protein